MREGDSSARTWPRTWGTVRLGRRCDYQPEEALLCSLSSFHPPSFSFLHRSVLIAFLCPPPPTALGFSYNMVNTRASPGPQGADLSQGKDNKQITIYYEVRCIRPSHCPRQSEDMGLRVACDLPKVKLPQDTIYLIPCLVYPELSLFLSPVT